jgi:hypothetical protein
MSTFFMAAVIIVAGLKVSLLMGYFILSLGRLVR